MDAPGLFIGIAGWNLPRENARLFPEEGSHLVRYAQRFNAVEINTSFYRNHQAKTYDRWRESVPEGFRFSVKLWRDITHDSRLLVSTGELAGVVSPILNLREKLGVLLVQLPPGLAFHGQAAREFFRELRQIFARPIACEPRHRSWVCAEARDVFLEYNITKVNADPEPCPDPLGIFEGLGEVRYDRLHGSPEMYKSSYDLDFLKKRARTISAESQDKTVWVIFDNTALWQAIPNAFELQVFAQSSP